MVYRGNNELERKGYQLESFIGDKSEYKSILFTDGINSKRNGCDFDKGEAVVDQESSIKIHMMPGGGFAGHLIKCD